MKTHLPRLRPLLLATALLAAASACFAQNITYTGTTTGSTNWSAATWTASSGSVPTDWTTTAGDIIAFGGNNSYALDVNATVGVIELTNKNGNANILGNGDVTGNDTTVLTMDGTGIAANTTLNIAANTALIVNANGNTSNGSQRNLNLGTSSTVGLLIDLNTDLAVANTGATDHQVNIYGTITNTNGNSTPETITILTNGGTGGSSVTTNAAITLGGSIGASGNAIAIVNAGTNSGNANLQSALGANVTSITQNSTTSKLFISGSNSAFVGNTVVNAGVLSIGSAYTFASGTSNQITLDGSASPVAGTDYGQITVTAGTTTLGGALTLNFSGTLAGDATYNLFTKSGSGALAGDFTAVSLAGSYVLGLTETAGVWSGTTDGIDFSFSASTGVLTATASAIPEPATYGALVGLAGLAFAAWRRRRCNQ